MLRLENINELVTSFLKTIPPGITQFSDDLKKNFHRVLLDTFNKMDLVTREEFEVQTAVLMRTRVRLEFLEKQLKNLELKLNKSDIP